MTTAACPSPGATSAIPFGNRLELVDAADAGFSAPGHDESRD